MKQRYLVSLAAISAVLIAAAPASAQTFGWAPDSYDFWSTDFDYASQGISATLANQISFTGSGYFHDHGTGGNGFQIWATVDGVDQTIWSSPITGFNNLSDFGTINFSGGVITRVGLSSNFYVGDAFHGFYDESFTLSHVAAAPEPASWAMMLGGFGLVGGVMRARRKIAVTFA